MGRAGDGIFGNAGGRRETARDEIDRFSSSGRTKAVSERLFSAAMACISTSGRAVSSISTSGRVPGEHAVVEGVDLKHGVFAHPVLRSWQKTAGQSPAEEEGPSGMVGTLSQRQNGRRASSSQAARSRPMSRIR